MATASVPAMSALLEKASQQYVECRRKVTAKAEEVKTLEKEIQTLFARITELGEGSVASKSVGRLELQIVTVEGEAPVDDAVVTVEIDPEYEEPEEPTVEAPKEEAPTEAEEKKEEEAAKEGEEAADEEKTTEESEDKTEDRTEETPAVDAAEEANVEKKQEGAPKEKPRRSVRWDDAEGFPLQVVFDPVQSREAVVTITIAPVAKDGEESEAVKEFRIPVSSLFQNNSINRWYVLKKVEHVHVDKAALTEVADEDDSTKEATEEAEKSAEEEETEKTAAEGETAEKSEDAALTEEKKSEEAAEEAEKAEEEAEKKTEEEAEGPHPTLVSAEATVESEDKVVVLKEGKLHVQIHFTMAEIEKLTQTAIAIAQQKQEAEAALALLDREALSLRTKYERLNANQRSVSAGGVVKPRSTLLGGRGLGAAVVRAEKSTYQKVKDSVSAVFTPQRTQVLTSFAIFCGSVALFHFQGDNLLA